MRIVLHCLITIRMTACVEGRCVCVRICVCVCACSHHPCLICIDAITPSLCHAFLHRQEEKTGLQYSIQRYENDKVLNTFQICNPTVDLRPAYHFLFIIRCWSMWRVQSASQAVSGSDQVVWPSGEPLGRQWPHCVAEVPLVSMTLPATETGRSKMAECREPRWCLSCFKQGSFDPFFFFFFWRQLFFGGLVSEPGGKSSAALLRLICWHFICFTGGEGGEAGKGGMWEKLKKSLRVSLLSGCSSKSSSACPEVGERCLNLHKVQGPVSVCQKLQETKRN